MHKLLITPLCGLSLIIASVQAQTTKEPSTNPNAAEPPPSNASARSSTNAVPKPAEVKSSRATAEEEPVQLSPFQVSVDKDRGYHGGSSMSGTRLNTDLDDIAASITVVTKQQLLDTAAVDINDIFAYEVSTEGTRTYTANFNDGRGDVDAVANSPETANRVRGLGQSNIAIGNFGATSSIPIDTYNVDAVEISRGPNSSIFGIGEVAGTVNLVPSTANVTRDFSKGQASWSSYGTYRGTMDLNRVLIDNVLALRLNGVAENRGFIREPSFDKTRRLQLSTTVKPFKYTTLRASYERFSEKFSRPNSNTPRELMTYWEQNGRPSWDPTTNTYSYTDAAGVVVTGSQVPPSNGGTLIGTSRLVGLGSTRVRPSMWIDQGKVDWFGLSWNAPATSTVANNREIVQVGLPANYNVPAQFVGTLPYNGVHTTNDKSFYNYESINLAGLNFGQKKAKIARVELEQFFLQTDRHVLAAQLSFFKEDIDDVSRNFVGGGGDGIPNTIYPDVMLKYPDGTPNPHFGQPYITALSPQTYKNPVDTKTYRLNLAYQLDLSREKNFFRFLGKQKVVGYGENYEKIFAPKSLRYTDQIVETYSWLPAPIRNVNAAKYSARYYLGDANGRNIDHATAAPDLSQNIAFHRFNSGIIDPIAPANTWYTQDVPIGTTYFSQNLQRVKTTTEGFVLQSFFWKDRIVTTWGRRKDTLRTRDNVTPEPASASDTKGLSKDLSWMNDFSDDPDLITNRITNARQNVGYTQNRGIVVKPLKWLHLRYSESNSLKPEAFGIDFQGNPLDNPHGQTKDYGVRLLTFGGKLIVGLTYFDTLSTGSRKNAASTLAGRITNFDFDLNPNSDGSKVDLEDWLVGELIMKDLAAGVNVTADQEADYLKKAHVLMGLTEERIAALRTYDKAVTADVQSKGYELEINYNPNQYWTLKINGTQTETIISSIGPSWQQYRDERMPLWTTIPGPYSGERYWTKVFPGSNIPQAIWIGQNEAPMKVQLALQGKSQPQVRKYKANALTSYNLAGISSNKYLRATTIGGSVRWEDKGGVGFYGAAPEADGLVRDYDASRPIMDGSHTYMDIFARYNFEMWRGRVRSSLQLNIRNVTESGRLQAYDANPDGTLTAYRIIDPREFVISLSFDL